MCRIACIRCLANDAGFAWHNYIMDQTEKGRTTSRQPANQ